MNAAQSGLPNNHNPVDLIWTPIQDFVGVYIEVNQATMAKIRSEVTSPIQLNRSNIGLALCRLPVINHSFIHIPASESGISHVIFIFCSTAVLQNIKNNLGNFWRYQTNIAFIWDEYALDCASNGRPHIFAGTRLAHARV